VLQDQGRFAEAEQILRQMLEMVPDEDPGMLMTMENLAVVLQRQKKYAEAEKMQQQTLS